MMEYPKIVDRELMKRSNMSLIFEQIYMQRDISRPQIARNIGMSVMSTGRLADNLIEMGLIDEGTASREAGPGRPPKTLRVAADRLLCAGAFIDRDGLSVGLLDPYGHPVARRQRNLAVGDTPPHQTLDTLADMLRSLQDEIPHSRWKPYLGVAAPGLICHNSGHVRFSSQLKWHDVHLKQYLEETMPGWTVVLDNDLKAWALAESWFGASKNYKNAVFLSVGSGIGAAAVVDNVIYRGRDNTAGEIGHVVIDPNGRLCDCGKIGCLQTKFADWAIIQDARTVKRDATLDDVFVQDERQELWAASLLQRVVDYIVISMNLLVNTYAPDVIVLGGYLFTRYPNLGRLVTAAYLSATKKHFNADVEMMETAFGDDSAMVGAAALAFQEYLRVCIGYHAA